ncbi:hypothetical protein RFF05_09485 [Bengtsoniella intestinalis]|uniref:hypothetical protein n=1 Tax=Bengtsoniella intestinalis TaxID=3073143 RepID=UPI00391FC4F9
MKDLWTEFVEGCVEHHDRTYRETEAFRYRHEVELQMDDLLHNSLTRSQKVMVDEVLFAQSSAQGDDCERLYQQGMKDAVWLLKKLGLLGLEV